MVEKVLSEKLVENERILAFMCGVTVTVHSTSLQEL